MENQHCKLRIQSHFNLTIARVGPKSWPNLGRTTQLRVNTLPIILMLSESEPMRVAV